MMNQTRFLSVGALALLFLSACQTTKPDSKPSLESLEQLYQTKQYTLLVPPLKEYAEKGDVKAQLMLAKCFDFGYGVPKDEAMAAQWYKKAAAQGNANAQDNLATCYILGSGVAKDDKMAVSLYQRAAATSYAPALNNLGLCYRNGEGVAQSMTISADYFRRAAQLGNKDGQYNLGRCYYHGLGVPHDLDQAKFWLNRAAEQGHQNAKAFMEENALLPTASTLPLGTETSADGGPAPSDNPMPAMAPLADPAAGTGIPDMPSEF